ncbi:hypothetical protein K435DRAFT_779970 [Dendrothele bispora CBS 962.96]|uniref:ML-like domain-containing protein n=1 Tax=Dendrothele bispora (strain CBS 962.96) TaxID=1314807 RepID=A0A4S8LUJ7_DENBC|nr:hypothetical protein K435DRAFT_779970 [Dendrothele bispora CBS 962.96]
MRFSTLLSTVAAAASFGFAAAQEAARFGSVSVSPCPFTGGQDVTITYNATTAASAGHQPELVDFFIQGTFTDTGNPSPRVLLQRNDFGADQVILTSDITIPEAINNFGASDWNVLALINYQEVGLTLIGGVFSSC